MATRNDISAERVRELFDYEPLTGILRWKVRLSKCVRVGAEAGCVNGGGHKIVRICGKIYLVHRIIWLWVTGFWPREQIDHKNLAGSDNRWENLREATSSQNQHNKGLQKNNRTGIKGVFQDKNKPGVWRAAIMLHGRNKYLGTFYTREEAGIAREAALKEIHGEFARTE